MFPAGAAGVPFPLVPIQILWINLVTDGLPAVALSMEPAAKKIDADTPAAPEESIFSHGMGWQILWQGAVIGLSTVLLFLFYLAPGATLAKARTVAFSVLVFPQLSYAFVCRSERVAPTGKSTENPRWWRRCLFPPLCNCPWFISLFAEDFPHLPPWAWATGCWWRAPLSFPSWQRLWQRPPSPVLPKRHRATIHPSCLGAGGEW